MDGIDFDFVGITLRIIEIIRKLNHMFVGIVTATDAF